MEDEELKEVAETYATERSRRLAESPSPGFGLHGKVWLLEDNTKPGQTALKVHRYPEAYHREKQIYERLRERGISEIAIPENLILQVPWLLNSADDLLALEMTVVTAPYLLDFASDRLDSLPEFSEMYWESRDAQLQEEWGERLETVQLVQAKFQAMGIYLLDLSPRNLRLD